MESMTAFVAYTDSGDLGRFDWEIRSINHRYLDIHLRLPEGFKLFDSLIRRQIGQLIGRGKLDCQLRFTPDDQSRASLSFNQELATGLLKNAAKVDALGVVDTAPVDPLSVLAWPGVLESAVVDVSQLQKPVLDSLVKACELLVKERQVEGAGIADFVGQRLVKIRQFVDQVELMLPKLLDDKKQKVKQQLAGFDVEHDQARLEQELVLLVNKLDVAEELSRLNSHLDLAKTLLSSSAGIGRKFDFLLQEFNREINTLGSKSFNHEVSAMVVEMKVLVEQIREQVQNIN